MFSVSSTKQKSSLQGSQLTWHGYGRSAVFQHEEERLDKFSPLRIVLSSHLRSRPSLIINPRSKHSAIEIRNDFALAIT